MNFFSWINVVGAGVLSAGAARAQIELPEHKIKPPVEKTAPDVPELTSKSLARRMGVVGNAASNRSLQRDELDLPASRPVKPAPPAPTAPEVAAPPVVAPSPVGAATALNEVGSTAGADFVFAEIARLSSHEDPMIEHAVQSLLRMGEIGRASAARSLKSEHVPTLLAAVKTLLQSGVSSDGELVQERLRSKLPNAVCALLVETLCALDPVRASPAFLIELLSHRQAVVRSASQRQLARLGAELEASLFVATLRGKDSDARLRATQLLASSKEPIAVELLLERLTDSSAVVARRALEALASNEDARIDNELLRRAFEDQWVLRTGAFALLALCEREDLRVAPILMPTHAPHLLRGLSSIDPFVSGSCAAALAGIGFRSSATQGLEWLDLDVPHRLVRAVSAEDFSADFSALLPTATRRLALITGHNFGSEGPKWIAWWAQHAEGFKAARAALAVSVDDAARMFVQVSSEDDPVSFTLLGPDPSLADAGTAGETIRLTPSQARALFEVFRACGVFGSERLPGVRGSSFEAGRSLTVAFGARAKSFRFTSVAPEPWFVQAFEAARAVRDRNRWQRFLDLRRHADFDAFWNAEAPWWESATDEGERARRLFDLVLVRADGVPVAQREASAIELEELARRPGVLTVDDFSAFVRLLGQERFVGPRARAWLRLAVAAGIRADDGRLAEPFADELVNVLIATFDTAAPVEVSSVLRAAGRDYARHSIADPRAFVRAVSAATIARDASPEDVESLRALLADSEERVVASALVALGENKVESARDDILSATLSQRRDVRIAAYRAVGLLGGADALSSLLVGLADTSDERFAPAAAEGVALLRDPGAVPVLMNLLARGPEDACYPHARRGLLHLGDESWDALLRAARSPSGGAQREAALLLSEQLVPQVTSILLTMLTESPRDARLAEELAVLSCVDHRGAVEPANAWWRWWEFVLHDDAQSWMLGALARLGEPGPAPEDLRAGTPEALRFLELVVQREETFLAERARREFARLLGRDPGALPPRGVERAAWARTLRESFEARSQH